MCIFFNSPLQGNFNPLSLVLITENKMVRRSHITVLLIYLLMITLSELVLTYHSVPAGLLCYSIILISLVISSTQSVTNIEKIKACFRDMCKDMFTLKPLIFFGLSPEKIRPVPMNIPSSIEREKNFSNLLKCLTLVPTIRMLSTSMPVAQISQIYWFLIINTPLFILAFLIIKSMSFRWSELGFNIGKLRTQFLISMTGIVLGVMDYSLLKPDPLINYLSIETVIIPSIILLMFTGFSEELIFRGIIQRGSERLIGSTYGLMFTSILFAVMHIGWRSFPDLIFVFGVGLYYGYIFQKTRSLLGITISHGVTNITMFLIAPFILPI